MKILTNVRFYRIAGIAQTLANFLEYLQKDSKTKIKVVGVNIVKKGEKQDPPPQYRTDIFTLYSAVFKYPEIKNAIKNSNNIAEVVEKYHPLIDYYVKIIEKEKPDLIWIHGTYFLPWCLYLAASRFDIPIVLHYHGVLSWEVKHWEKKFRIFFQEMEKQFDSDRILYLFPSALTKSVVEKEIFGHPVKNAHILPNGIPEYFFEKAAGTAKKNDIGFVSRWTFIKNLKFIEKFSKNNLKKGVNPYRIKIITDSKLKRNIIRKFDGLANFIKPIKNDLLPEFYQSTKIILCPSYFETYGNVAQEALACGTPALINKNMGVAETYRCLGLDELIVDFSSTKKLLARLDYYLNYPIDQKVIDKLKRDFSTTKIFDHLTTIFKDIAEQKNNTPVFTLAVACFQLLPGLMSFIF